MEIDLTSYFRMFKKRLWIIALFIFLFTVPAYLLSEDTYEPIYQASSDLYLTFPEDQSQPAEYDVIRFIFETETMMGNVLQTFPDLEMTAGQLSRAISLTELSGSRVLRISAKDASYDKAVRMVNDVSHIFQVEMPKWINVESIIVLNPAQYIDNPQPINPPSNQQLQMTLLSLVVAVVVSIGVIFLLDVMDDTLKTDKEIREIFGKPTWAAVPKMRSKDHKMKNKLLLRKAAPTGREGVYATKTE